MKTKKQQYWYFFSVGRDMQTGRMELQCYLEVIPKKVEDVLEYIVLAKDDMYKYCYKMSSEDIAKTLKIDDVAAQLQMMKMSADANNAMMCMLKCDFQMSREELSNYVSILKYREVKKYRI